MPCRPSGGEETDIGSALGIDNGQDLPTTGPKEHAALLAVVVALVDLFDAKGIAEDSRHLRETYTMTGHVGSRLGEVSLERPHEPYADMRRA
jgi:hypothetical protein